MLPGCAGDLAAEGAEGAGKGEGGVTSRGAGVVAPFQKVGLVGNEGAQPESSLLRAPAQLSH